MARSAFAAVAAAWFVTLPAFAADIPSRPATAPVVAAAPVFSWTGLYAGLNVGYGSARPSTSATALGTTTVLDSQSMNGAVGGGQVGANWQLGPMVLGIEGDLQWSGQKQTATAAGISATDRINTFGTARGRVGYAFDRWMVYGTAGWVYGTYRTELTVPILGTGSYSSSRGGLAAGGGIETAFAGNWTAKLEYLYLDTGKNTDSTTLAGVVLNTQVKDHVIRFGVNYLFH